jgi:hypothetical protein
MNYAEEQNLIYLLRELINMQDHVTHANEQGPEFAENTRLLIVEREKIYDQILKFVRHLTSIAVDRSTGN